MSEKHKQLGYLGVDQYGGKYMIKKFPRKELLEQTGFSRADKIYVDTPGGAVHEGYVIGGLWIEVYRIYQWKESR